MTPEQISEVQSRVSRKGRLREVAEGRWRNPALDDQAREKLSLPRKHGDNPLLHSALEKLRRGAMSGLTPEEQQVYRAYRQELAAQRREDVRAKARERYRARTATEEGRQREKVKWQRANARRRERKTGK
jgi:hypothetical protein